MPKDKYATQVGANVRLAAAGGCLPPETPKAKKEKGKEAKGEKAPRGKKEKAAAAAS